MTARSTRLVLVPGLACTEDLFVDQIATLRGDLASNYPPAEPGALFSVSRSKRLEGDADASPAHCAT